MIDYSNLEKNKELLPLEVYTCDLNLGSLNKVYIDIINLEGDKQHRSTNIKADMTDWNLNNKYKEFEPLAKVFSDIYKHILQISHPQWYENIQIYHGHDYRFKNIDIWGAKYKSREKTIPHSHMPSTISMCLYLKVPKGCPGLTFNDLSKTISVKENQMIIFPGTIVHSVKSKKFRGNRYVLAANLNISDE